MDGGAGDGGIVSDVGPTECYASATEVEVELQVQIEEQSEGRFQPSVSAERLECD